MPIQVSLLNIIFLSVQRIIVKILAPHYDCMLMQVSLFIVTFSHILKIIVVTNLGFLKWLWYLNWMKYLGRNRRSHWCSAVQLRLWKHDHVRPGSLTFWRISELSKLLITFTVDHISPHTRRLRLPATVPRTRCPVTRFRITLQDNSMFDKSNPGWQPLQRDRVWKDRGGGGEKTQKLSGMSLSQDLFKYESAGHSGTLRSSETRPTISTRANKSCRFKCWHLLDSKRRSDI